MRHYVTGQFRSDADMTKYLFLKHFEASTEIYGTFLMRHRTTWHGRYCILGTFLAANVVGYFDDRVGVVMCGHAHIGLPSADFDRYRDVHCIRAVLN